MPARSRKQQALFAIAEHEPEKLYPQNQRLASLPHQTLQDFAATKGPFEKAKTMLRQGR